MVSEFMIFKSMLSNDNVVGVGVRVHVRVRCITLRVTYLTNIKGFCPICVAKLAPPINSRIGMTIDDRA